MISTKKIYQGMKRKELEDALIGMQQEIDLIVEELCARRKSGRLEEK